MTKIYIKEVTELFDEFCGIEEARAALRVIGDHDDLLVTTQLRAAIEHAENYLRLNIIKKEIVVCVENCNSKELYLPATPVLSIENISYEEKGMQVMNPENYELRNNRIIFKKTMNNKSLEISYISGFKMIPESIRQGIFMHLNILYDREVVNAETLESVMILYKPYRKIILGR